MSNRREPNTRHKPHRVAAMGGTPMLQARWLTNVAFALSLIIVIARLTTPDALREPWEVTPGSEFVPAAPGPATGLVFDLLACMPALLVLARRAVDQDFRLSLRWSQIPLFTLASWAVLSTAWASDKFAAAVTSAHFFAAACLLWAMSQLVKTAGRFRFVASVCFGLLLVMVVQSAMYKFIDVPANTAYWNEHKAEILKARNWDENSFTAIQFAQKLTRGELVGFFNSANTFAAVGVLLFAACIGIGIQKLVDRDPPPWVILILVSLFSLVWIVACAKSKTAGATPMLGVIILCLFFPFIQQLSSRHRLTYFGGVFFVALAMLAVVGHGLHHHGLFAGHLSNSLDFRWKYWVASAGIFKGHPLVGVGWSNFGLYYLAHRLPEAAEEIKDPHSFLVRFFVELGLVGGILCILWLLRLAWELTLPSDDSQPAMADDSKTGLGEIVVIPVLGMVLSILATEDFSSPGLLWLLLKPILYLLVLLVGGVAASIRTAEDLDHRPAPWIYYCTLTGLGLFLLHNLIDFSWFEPGAMFVFIALIGSVQGMAAERRNGDMGLRPMPATFVDQKTSTPHAISTGQRPVSRGRGFAIAIAGFFALGWLVVAVAFVMPVIAAEALAVAANESIRTAPAQQTMDAVFHYQKAADDLKEASGWVPYNSDYLYRRANALINIGQADAAESLLDRAKQIDPLQTNAYLLDAGIQLHKKIPDRAAVKADYQTVLALNPNDVSLHLQYARALKLLGLHDEAKQQFEQALAADAALPVGEPKRLSPREIEGLKTQAESP